MATEDVRDLLISPVEDVRSALKQLDRTGLRILFVVGNEGQLIGVITDGDIRRYLLRDGSLNFTISECYNKNPRFVTVGTSEAEVRDMMLAHKVDVLPVLDSSKKVVGFHTLAKIFTASPPKKEHIALPVVIMSGGKGTRLDPFTKILPKPLIPVGDKPVIEVIMDRFAEHGVAEFYLTLNYKGQMIKSYFESVEMPYRLHYLWETEFLGTAGSLKLMPQEVAGTFMVSNCDIIIDTDYADLLRFHRNNGYDITVVGSIQHYSIPYGILEYETGGLLKSIKEKPEYDFMVNTGMYVLERPVVDLIPGEAVFHMTDLLAAVMARGGRVGVYPVSEKSYIDIGQWEEYRKNLHRLHVD